MPKWKTPSWKSWNLDVFPKTPFKRKQRRLIITIGLKFARQEHQMTQAALSKRSGIAQSTISEIENGKRNVSVEKLDKLAEAMGMRVEVKFISEYLFPKS